ncbi:hypothetical protein V5O48_014922 [Marasmius crinis-equi]|uniref:Uncharacterized protein n=1 Tax=Marasmius crinis-equi TaxID=585013 RepID=A0ABR3EVY7_9AGAR
MPRPRLHFTPEEKQQANRRKHAKYYQKHKAEIQFKRAEKKEESRKRSKKGKQLMQRRESLNSRTDSDQKDTSEPQFQRTKVKLVLPEQPSVLAARKWEGKAQNLYQKILKLYGEHPTHHGYCDDLYHRYVAEYQAPAGEDDNAYVEPFEQANSQMESYTRRLRRYKQKLLEEVGQGDEYWRVDKLEKKAFIAASAISDIYCEAFLGLEHVQQMYNRRKFPFQNSGKAPTP